MKRLIFWRLIFRWSLYVPFPCLTDWLWHRKMDAFYRAHPVDWIHDSGGLHPVIESMRAW